MMEKSCCPTQSVLKKEWKAMTQAYKVVIECDSQGGYVATFPELLGCRAQARSLKGLMERIQEAMALCPEESELAAAPLQAVPDREPGD